MLHAAKIVVGSRWEGRKVAVLSMEARSHAVRVRRISPSAVLMARVAAVRVFTHGLRAGSVAVSSVVDRR